MTYKVHKSESVHAVMVMHNPGQMQQRYYERAALQIGSFTITMDTICYLPLRELVQSSSMDEVRTFQGDRLVGVLMYWLTNSTQVLRVFPVARGIYMEDHRQIVNEDRIYALIARCELQQPTTQEMDEILQEMWDGTDAANWTDLP